jgi:signal transduction histidine kinase
MSAIPDLSARCRRLLQPLNLAAFGTWCLIASEQGSRLWRIDSPALWPVLATLAVFLAAFLARELVAGRSAQRLMLLLQMGSALGNGLLMQSGTGPILGVVAAAQLPFLFEVRAAVALLVAMLAAYTWIFATQWTLERPFFTAALIGGFQVFAWLTARLAHTAERQRDELAEVNAHLLATRSLLEAGARDGERLRLSRELHDVAGHSLTALKLNLEVALRLPEAERGAKIVAARDLADALLDDIRAVVGQLRQHDGVDLEPALRALTARLPGPQIELDLEPGLRVAQVGQAEALLRCVQEGLTNALRHSGARHVRVSVRHEGDAIRAEVHDDGRGSERAIAGHGLTGMRERIEEAGGRLEIDTAPGRGFRIMALVPQAGV